jgi:hypothetical protein
MYTKRSVPTIHHEKTRSLTQCPGHLIRLCNRSPRDRRADPLHLSSGAIFVSPQNHGCLRSSHWQTVPDCSGAHRPGRREHRHLAFTTTAVLLCLPPRWLQVCTWIGHHQVAISKPSNRDVPSFPDSMGYYICIAQRAELFKYREHGSLQVPRCGERDHHVH